MAHQQESFLPFSSRQSLSCCLSRVAKRSTPKPRGPLYSPSEPCGPFPHFRTAWFSLFLLQNHMALFLFPQNLMVPSSLQRLMVYPLLQSRMVYSFLGLPGLGLNPSAHLPLQPHSRFLLHSVSPASIPRILPALLSCHCKSGQVWPHGVEPIISKLSCRPCNQAL